MVTEQGSFTPYHHISNLCGCQRERFFICENFYSVCQVQLYQKQKKYKKSNLLYCTKRKKQKEKKTNRKGKKINKKETERREK